MKEIISTVTAAIGAFAFICLGAYLVTPEPQPETMTLAQISTDTTTTCPTAPGQDRTYYVERVR